MPNQVARELVITVPLPNDKGRTGDGRPTVRRIRSHWLELGRRLRDFRARYGVTQTEVARAVGAGDASTVAEWESGVNVPEGIRREYLIELLEGRRWRELRAVASPQALRERYCERDGDWARGVAARQGRGEEHQADLRRVEDAAFGLRWLELAHGRRFDLRGSLVPQLPLALLDGETGDGRAET